MAPYVCNRRGISIKLVLFFLGFFALAQAATHHPQKFLNKIQKTQGEGASIYKHFCISCHDPHPLIALGAPRKKNEEDWAPRVKQGMPLLFQHTDQGLRSMPPRGGCFECTDEQLILAILNMLPDRLK